MIVMMDTKIASSAQCRAARALLNWTQAKLAERAGVARKTVADYELGERTLHVRTRRDIMNALQEAGVEFVWSDEMDGAPVATKGEGVRFTRTPAHS